MGFVGRDQLIKKEKLDIERVDLDDNDFTFVRQMTARERDRFEQSLMRENEKPDGTVEFKRDLTDFRAKIAICTVCNKQGENVFKPGDASQLSKNISAKRLEPIVNKAQEMNKITEKDKENLVKKSEVAQDGDSSSDSV